MRDGYAPDPDVKGRNAVKEEAKEKDPSFYMIVDIMDGDRGLPVLARNSICKGLKWLAYMKVFGGLYKLNGKDKPACSKILVASIKVCTPYFKGKGCSSDELVAANVHFHYMCATKGFLRF